MKKQRKTGGVSSYRASAPHNRVSYLFLFRCQLSVDLAFVSRAGHSASVSGGGGAGIPSGIINN